jgi:hypothetical protein
MEGKDEDHLAERNGFSDDFCNDFCEAVPPSFWAVLHQPPTSQKKASL